VLARDSLHRALRKRREVQMSGVWWHVKLEMALQGASSYQGDSFLGQRLGPNFPAAGAKLMPRIAPERAQNTLGMTKFSVWGP
jgi:hypothetical protein